MLFFYEGCNRLGGVYEIRNRISNKSYIGSAKQFNERWNGHKSSLNSNKHRSGYLQNSFNKLKEQFGHDDFLEFHIVEIMKNSTMEQRKRKEEYWINQFIKEHGKRNLYNNRLKPTKEDKIWSSSPNETKKRLSNSLKIFYQTTKRGKELKEKYSNFFSKTYEEIYGKERAKEIKERKSISLTGKKRSEKVKQKMGEMAKKRWQNKEYIKHMSEIHKGWKPSEETKEKWRKVFKGKKQTPEQIAARAKGMEKEYSFLSPIGEVVYIKGLKQFCKENKLSESCMCLVANGKQKHHKGWKRYESSST